MPDLKPWDTCLQCGLDITTKKDGTLRAHGRPSRRCSGSGQAGQKAVELQRIKAETEALFAGIYEHIGNLDRQLAAIDQLLGEDRA